MVQKAFDMFFCHCVRCFNFKNNILSESNEIKFYFQYMIKVLKNFI